MFEFLFNKVVGLPNTHPRSSSPEVLFKISQNLQENRLQQASGCNFIKKRLWHRCFPVDFANFLKTPFLQNTSGQMLPKRVFERPVTLLKRHNNTGVSCEYYCFLKTPFLQNTSGGCICRDNILFDWLLKNSLFLQ